MFCWYLLDLVDIYHQYYSVFLLYSYSKKMKHFCENPKQIKGGKGQNSNTYCDKNSLVLTKLPETIFNRKSIGEIIVKTLQMTPVLFRNSSPQGWFPVGRTLCFQLAGFKPVCMVSSAKVCISAKFNMLKGHAERHAAYGFISYHCFIITVCCEYNLK